MSGVMRARERRVPWPGCRDGPKRGTRYCRSSGSPDALSTWLERRQQARPSRDFGPAEYMRYLFKERARAAVEAVGTEYAPDLEERT